MFHGQQICIRPQKKPLRHSYTLTNYEEALSTVCCESIPYDNINKKY